METGAYENIKLFIIKDKTSMDMEERCAISYKKLHKLDSKNKLFEIEPCGHRFSKTHIKRFISMGNQTCPVCRRKITNGKEFLSDNVESDSFLSFCTLKLLICCCH